jgi:hypothetical protein
MARHTIPRPADHYQRAGLVAIVRTQALHLGSSQFDISPCIIRMSARFHVFRERRDSIFVLAFPFQTSSLAFAWGIRFPLYTRFMSESHEKWILGYTRGVSIPSKRRA